jgi:transcriptional regulator with XRE-family HTH domain
MSPKYPNNLPVWLKLRMESQNWGVRELARRAGVSHPRISDALNGKEPSLDTAIVLARLFKETPEAILRIAGVLPPIPEIDEFREALIKETQDMSRDELYELLAYIGMKKRLRNAESRNLDSVSAKRQIK